MQQTCNSVIYKQKNIILLLVSTTLLLLFFQNCGLGFQSAQLSELGSIDLSLNDDSRVSNPVVDPVLRQQIATQFQDSTFRQIVENVLFQKTNFKIGYANPQFYSRTGNDVLTNCFSTAANPINVANFGPCFNGQAGDVTAHLDFAVKEFNIFTPEGSQKMDITQPLNPGVGLGVNNLNFRYNLSDVENMIDSMGVEEGDISLHGHTLIWYTANPGWFNQVNSTEEITAIMRDRILTLLDNTVGGI